nr:MAG TPA: hypothetical protein [Caudoviricetes sp.]
MPPTASWKLWTASSKTDALTGLHRKAAPPHYPGSPPGHLVLYYCCLEYAFFWCLCAQTEHICIKIMVKCSEMRCFCD